MKTQTKSKTKTKTKKTTNQTKIQNNPWFPVVLSVIITALVTGSLTWIILSKKTARVESKPETRSKDEFKDWAAKNQSLREETAEKKKQESMERENERLSLTDASKTWSIDLLETDDAILSEPPYDEKKEYDAVITDFIFS